VYAREGSDCAVVPVKRPNQGAPASAEVVEGRARTQENDAGPGTSPTRSGERVSQGFGGVRQAARERKQERFTALLHHLTVEQLRGSYYALKRNAAPGVDGMRWGEYEDGLEDRLKDLHGRVHRGAYRAQPSRRVYIPKADGFLREFQERLAKFGLEVHPEKTRLIEFGRFARVNRKQRGEGKPETFTFLGFTHYCGTNSQGHFVVWRRTAAKRMRAKLQAIKQELRRKMHEPVGAVGEWLKRVVAGYYRYHAVPGNIVVLGRFRDRLCGLWRHVLRRRSQKRRPGWDRLRPLFQRWIPRPHVLHPYPDARFDATHPR